jgi:hypothetical protein
MVVGTQGLVGPARTVWLFDRRAYDASGRVVGVLTTARTEKFPQ